MHGVAVNNLLDSFIGKVLFDFVIKNYCKIYGLKIQKVNITDNIISVEIYCKESEQIKIIS